MLVKKTFNQSTLGDLLTCSESRAAVNSIEVSFDAEDQVLLVNWEGELTSDDIRKGYEMMMEQVRLYKPKKLLLDFQKRGIIRRMDQRWVFSTVFPQVLQTVGDNVFVAIVLPVVLYYGLVAEMNGDELMHENNFLIIHHSLYREEAYRWLNSMSFTS